MVTRLLQVIIQQMIQLQYRSSLIQSPLLRALTSASRLTMHNILIMRANMKIHACTSDHYSQSTISGGPIATNLVRG